MIFRVTTLIALLICCCTSVAEDQSAANQSSNDHAAEKLQGRWEIVGGVNQGHELGEDEVAGTYLTVTTNSIVTYDHSQQEKFRAVFTIDESKKPIHITMMSVPEHAPTDAKTPEERASQRDATALGILKFDGDRRCVLCYALPGADRPRKFLSPEGSKIMLFRLDKQRLDESRIEEIKQE